MPGLGATPWFTHCKRRTGFQEQVRMVDNLSFGSGVCLAGRFNCRHENPGEPKWGSICFSLNPKSRPSRRTNLFLALGIPAPARANLGPFPRNLHSPQLESLGLSHQQIRWALILGPSLAVKYPKGSLQKKLVWTFRLLDGSFLCLSH